eukprot:CAMPEP_0174732184 /NCGR_PEP_ID=MMETSP1094-20130205/58958_1 /TAXON_ID=156173 /ORGANISM="Chrysochromulina brevifilum, Strain UTEX LB 985" /LENGTH=53 /DNA_ID=CAMNT_0015934675 /DNA_START=132 /DNA_END=293 /DNA_ORIENTATION=+
MTYLHAHSTIYAPIQALLQRGGRELAANDDETALTGLPRGPLGPQSALKLHMH